MLVLTRREGESICIGDQVVITILASENGRTRIGISAPSSVRVDRKEVRERIIANNAHSHQAIDLECANMVLEAAHSH